MAIKYRKQGEVTLNPDDGGSITLENPTGRVLGYEYRPEEGKIMLTIQAADHLNTVERQYTIPVDEQAATTFHTAFFTEVARLAAAGKTEFQNLELI